MYTENADSSTIHGVTFLRTTEVLTVNSIGQLKLWDFRQQGNEPVQILAMSDIHTIRIFTDMPRNYIRCFLLLFFLYTIKECAKGFCIRLFSSYCENGTLFVKTRFVMYLVTVTPVVCSTGDRVPLHCVGRHPNQQHIVATGGQDGMLCIWDVRQGNMPFSLMEAHSAESKSVLIICLCRNFMHPVTQIFYSVLSVNK